MATRLTGVLKAAIAAAGAMYFFDPDVGRRRRSLVRDKVSHALRAARRELDVQLRDVANRVAGLSAELRRATSEGTVSDRVIAERVRARLGGLQHPGAISVEVHQGCVLVRGPVLADDAERARSAVASIAGVRSVQDELEVHADPGGVPALQGPPRRRGYGRLDPATRFLLESAAVVAVTASPLRRLFRPFRLLRAGAVLGLGAAVATAESARIAALRGQEEAARERRESWTADRNELL